MPSQTPLFLRVPQGGGWQRRGWLSFGSSTQRIESLVDSRQGTWVPEITWGLRVLGKGRDWEDLCSVVCACALVQNLVPRIGRGKQNKVLTVSRRVVPTGQGGPPHESGSAPPSVSAASWSWGRGYGPARASEDSWEGQEGRRRCGKEKILGSHGEARSIFRGRQRG